MNTNTNSRHLPYFFHIVRKDQSVTYTICKLLCYLYIKYNNTYINVCMYVYIYYIYVFIYLYDIWYALDICMAIKFTDKT